MKMGMFLSFHINFNLKSRFYINLPTFVPPYIIMIKGLLSQTLSNFFFFFIPSSLKEMDLRRSTSTCVQLCWRSSLRKFRHDRTFR